MGVFRFKRFEVRNDLAAQKVGTDAVLLGAAMTLPIAPPHTTNVQQEHRDISAAPGDLGAEPPQTTNVQHLLDIGTGTGVIALMAAQRLADLAAAGVPETVASPQAAVSPETAGTRAHFQILAIDIDPAAISEATANFASSPWSTFLKADEISLNDLDKKPITIKASAKSYKSSVKTKKYTVSLSTVPSVHDGKVYLSPKLVTLTVNGKTYTGKTNDNGQVTFKITNLNKKGKYVANISYKGDKTYEEAVKSVKLSVK